MNGYEQIANRLRSSTVQVVNGRGGGSGIVWDKQGTIVSNAHVVRGPGTTVVFASGEKVRAKVIRRDAERDLVLLQTQADMAPAAAIGDSSKLRAGELAIAVGNPLGFTGALSAGMIHSVSPLPIGGRRNWVQADVRLAPGNSGGILANAAGEVIGVNTMIFEGLGLAIPSNEAASFAQGEAHEPVRLGVEMLPIPEGLIVVRVARGSLAERARVIVGDVIRCSSDELRVLLDGVRTRGESEIPVLRAGIEKTLRVHTLEAKAA